MPELTDLQPVRPELTLADKYDLPRMRELITCAEDRQETRANRAAALVELVGGRFPELTRESAAAELARAYPDELAAAAQRAATELQVAQAQAEGEQVYA